MEVDRRCVRNGGAVDEQGWAQHGRLEVEHRWAAGGNWQGTSGQREREMIDRSGR